MLHKSINYVDFNGNKRVKDCYFNLTKSELAAMELKTPGGFEGFIRKMIQADDTKQLAELFENLIIVSYGEISANGERFVKHGPNGDYQLGKEFTESAAYDALYMELISDAQKLSTFIAKIVPKDIAASMNTPEMDQKIVELKKEYGVEDQKKE